MTKTGMNGKGASSGYAYDRDEMSFSDDEAGLNGQQGGEGEPESKKFKDDKEQEEVVGNLVSLMKEVEQGTEMTNAERSLVNKVQKQVDPAMRATNEELKKHKKSVRHNEAHAIAVKSVNEAGKKCVGLAIAGACNDPVVPINTVVTRIRGAINEENAKLRYEPKDAEGAAVGTFNKVLLGAGDELLEGDASGYGKRMANYFDKEFSKDFKREYGDELKRFDSVHEKKEKKESKGGKYGGGKDGGGKKGKGKKGGKKGGGAGPCFHAAKDGECSWGEECNFSHEDLEGWQFDALASSRSDIHALGIEAINENMAKVRAWEEI